MSADSYSPQPNPPFGQNWERYGVDDWDVGDEMARWSEPLIADQVYRRYERYLGDRNAASETLGRLHCRMWRLLLSGKAAEAQSVLRHLSSVARLANLDDRLLESINAAIFNDLLGVIVRRCRCSREMTRVAGRMLLQAAETLQADRSDNASGGRSE